MATIPLIEDADATGKTREVFDDIKATKGIDFVPNIWRSLAIDPEHLESCWRRVKTIMADGALDRRTKEIIAVAVSITNGCEYCVNSHSAALQKQGLSAQGLAEVVAVTELFNAMNRVAVAYQIDVDVRPAVDGWSDAQPQVSSA